MNHEWVDTLWCLLWCRDALRSLWSWGGGRSTACSWASQGAKGGPRRCEPWCKDCKAPHCRIRIQESGGIQRWNSDHISFYVEFRYFFKRNTKFLSSFLCIFTYSYFFRVSGTLCLCLRSSRGEEIHSTGEVRFEIFYEGKEGKCVSFRKVLVGGNGRKWRQKLPLVLGLEFRCLTMRCVVARCRSQ